MTMLYRGSIRKDVIIPYVSLGKADENRNLR